MNYNKPGQVRSPRGYTKHIKPLFDGGEEGYSIAILENCEGNHNIGVRWNVSEKEWDDTRKTEKEMICVGMPQSRGYSVWFILPDSSWKFVPQIIKDEISVNDKLNFVKNMLEEIQDEVYKIVAERFRY